MSIVIKMATQKIHARRYMVNQQIENPNNIIIKVEAIKFLQNFKGKKLPLGERSIQSKWNNSIKYFQTFKHLVSSTHIPSSLLAYKGNILKVLSNAS